MRRQVQLKQSLGSAIADAITDHNFADRASIKIRPGAPDRLEGTSKLRGAMMLPVSRLVADPDQPRKEFDAEDLDRLATSIRSRGVLQPIRVRYDENRCAWIIVAGERRWRACLLIGLEMVPAVEAGHQSPQDTLAEQLIENCVRASLSHLEQARAIQRLIERTGWTQTRVSEELGISAGQVSKVLALLHVPEEVQQRVHSGELAVAAAAPLARVSPEEAVEIAASGGDTRTVRKAAERAGARSTARTSRYEDRWGDCSVTIVVRRPDVSRDEFRKVIEEALTRCGTGVE